MANSVNWLFNAFLLLFILHASFMLFFYFWDVGLTFFCYALFPLFILRSLFFEIYSSRFILQTLFFKMCDVFILHTFLLFFTFLLDAPQLRAI
jgi:hypothetical protein